MSRNYFTDNEEKVHNRVLVLKELVAAQELKDVPCTSLKNQLDELRVLCKLLHENVVELTESVIAATKDGT